MQSFAGMLDVQSFPRHAREPEATDHQRQDDRNDRVDQGDEEQHGVDGGRHREEVAHDMQPSERDQYEDMTELHLRIWSSPDDERRGHRDDHQLREVP
eukprot:5287859-Heterocapsa_arctica.AAC.1